MFRHPWHPPTTHFPIGCLASSAVWDVLALVTGDSAFWAVSFHVTWLGLLLALPAVVTGLLELRRIRGAKAHATRAVRHALVMTSAASAYALSAIARAGTAPPLGFDRALAVGLELAGLVALGVGGYLGGSMVYEHGVATRDERLDSAER